MRHGWLSTWASRGHVWRTRGRSLPSAHVRTRGTIMATATTAAVTITPTSTELEGRAARVPWEPVMSDSTIRPTTVTTTALTCTSATVATARGAGTFRRVRRRMLRACLLYTSDAADEEDS